MAPNNTVCTALAKSQRAHRDVLERVKTHRNEFKNLGMLFIEMTHAQITNKLKVQHRNACRATSLNAKRIWLFPIVGGKDEREERYLFGSACALRTCSSSPHAPSSGLLRFMALAPAAKQVCSVVCRPAFSTPTSTEICLQKTCLRKLYRNNIPNIHFHSDF